MTYSLPCVTIGMTFICHCGPLIILCLYVCARALTACVCVSVFVFNPNEVALAIPSV